MAQQSQEAITAALAALAGAPPSNEGLPLSDQPFAPPAEPSPAVAPTPPVVPAPTPPSEIEALRAQLREKDLLLEGTRQAQEIAQEQRRLAQRMQQAMGAVETEVQRVQQYLAGIGYRPEDTAYAVQQFKAAKEAEVKAQVAQQSIAQKANQFASYMTQKAHAAAKYSKQYDVPVEELMKYNSSAEM